MGSGGLEERPKTATIVRVYHRGGMAERTMAAVLKTVMRLVCIVGSNPTPSAKTDIKWPVFQDTEHTMPRQPHPNGHKMVTNFFGGPTIVHVLTTLRLLQR